MTGAALAPAELDLLVDVSEHTLRIALEEHRRWTPDITRFPIALHAPGAVFVTLRRGERLLGCVGTLEAVDPVVRVVADRTLAAAFSDPRTTGVRAEDWELLEIEVSVLSALTPLAVDTHAGLVAHVASHPSEGLLVEAGHQRATFLPSVRDQLPDAAEFVAALWDKAGLRAGTWPAGISVTTYSVTKATRSAPRAPLHSELWATQAPSWSN